jgi:hypothetical protein
MIEPAANTDMSMTQTQRSSAGTGTSSSTSTQIVPSGSKIHSAFNSPRLSPIKSSENNTQQAVVSGSSQFKSQPNKVDYQPSTAKKRRNGGANRAPEKDMQGFKQTQFAASSPGLSVFQFKKENRMPACTLSTANNTTANNMDVITIDSDECSAEIVNQTIEVEDEGNDESGIVFKRSKQTPFKEVIPNVRKVIMETSKTMTPIGKSSSMSISGGGSFEFKCIACKNVLGELKLTPDAYDELDSDYLRELPKQIVEYALGHVYTRLIVIKDENSKQTLLEQISCAPSTCAINSSGLTMNSFLDDRHCWQFYACQSCQSVVALVLKFTMNKSKFSILHNEKLLLIDP